MDSLKQLLIKSVIQNKDNDDLKEFKKLLDFIDNNIKLSLSCADDEVASFLLTSLLSLRSYMNSKIVIESASNEINNKLIVAINTRTDKVIVPTIIVFLSLLRILFFEGTIISSGDDSIGIDKI